MLAGAKDCQYKVFQPQEVRHRSPGLLILPIVLSQRRFVRNEKTGVFYLPDR